MARQEIVCGLDIGSGKITCVIGKYDPARDVIEIVSSGQTSCRGVKGGVVVNIDETANAIKETVEDAEEQVKEYIRDVYLGVRGSHLQTLSNRGVISISRTDKEITAEDVASVIDNAKAIQISPDREIIDTIPQDFSLDRQKGVPNPVGMEGHYLEVYVHIVTAAITHLNNVYKSVAKGGFSVVEPIYGLLGLSDVVVTDEEKELGCLLVDFGGQTVGLAIYSEGSIRYSRELSYGSDLITRDISHALRTSIAQAQFIKEKHGTAMKSLLKDNEEIEFMAVDGRTIRKTTLQNLAEIISPRVEEIFEKMNEEIQNSEYADVIVPGGVILTGGGALLSGINTACENILNMSTRLGLPLNINGSNEIISNPTYATAIGLLKYRPSSDTQYRRRLSKRIPFWQRLRDLFEK